MTSTVPSMSSRTPWQGSEHSDLPLLFYISALDKRAERVSMKINADIYVKDVPGQLVASLEPISTYEGNIIGVVHNREQVISGRILVKIIFDMDATNLELLKKEWRSKDVIIVKMDEAVESYSMDYMLVGNITASQIEDIMERASKDIDLQSVEIGYSSKGSNGSRTAMISVSVSSKKDLAGLNDFLSKEAADSELTYIRGVDA